MGYSGKGKKTIGANIEVLIADYIEARAMRLDKTLSWATGRIIHYWLDQGAPALSEADKNMKALPIENFQHEQKLKHALVKMGKGRGDSSPPFHKR